MSVKREGYEFWIHDLKKCRFIVAPMVDQSELAWRILSRRHGAELCYSPMLHSSVFVRDAEYRKESLASCAEDRPLIVQFCANDPDVFLKAAKMAEPHCDAIDLNLGCPQTIARKGHYGVFLQDEWDLLSRMVSLCHENLSVPITCKIRIFNDIDKTVRYAKMLESAGCQILTVHGRTKEQRGVDTGLADWDAIKAVKENMSIPVFANGNVQSHGDALRCLEYTGVDGIMSAEGNLHNPAIFREYRPLVWEIADEYLELVGKYPCPLSYSRGHLFKLWHHVMIENHDLRDKLAVAKNIQEMKEISLEIRRRLQHLVETENKIQTNDIPMWRCKPYFRPGPSSKKTENKETVNKMKRAAEEAGEENSGEKQLSKKQMRKAEKKVKADLVKARRENAKWMKCEKCNGNPRGTKCVFGMCRVCCKHKTSIETLDCPGHNFLFKTKRVNNSSKEDEKQLRLMEPSFENNTQEDKGSNLISLEIVPS